MPNTVETRAISCDACGGPHHAGESCSAGRFNCDYCATDNLVLPEESNSVYEGKIQASLAKLKPNLANSFEDLFKRGVPQILQSQDGVLSRFGIQHIGSVNAEIASRIETIYSTVESSGALALLQRDELRPMRGIATDVVAGHLADILEPTSRDKNSKKDYSAQRERYERAERMLFSISGARYLDSCQ